MLKGHLINKNYNLLNCLYLTIFKIARKVHLPFNLCRISYQTQNSCMSVIDNWNQDDAKIILYLFSLDMFLSCMSIMRKTEEKNQIFFGICLDPFMNTLHGLQGAQVSYVVSSSPGEAPVYNIANFPVLYIFL